MARGAELTVVSSLHTGAGRRLPAAHGLCMTLQPTQGCYTIVLTVVDATGAEHVLDLGCCPEGGDWHRVVVVAQGSLDGYINVFDAGSGDVLFKYDTVRAFTGINGVPGLGGAIDNASITAANGTLYVSSGYGMFGQTGGNVLLAFRPR